MAAQPTFLVEPPPTKSAARMYDEDRSEDGYVWNVTRLWAWRPDVQQAFVALRAGLMDASSLGERDWAVLVAATAAQRNDSYCSLAWGAKLARLADAETAADVISGRPTPSLSPREVALAEWAGRVVDDPNATTEADVKGLRDAGLGDREIFEATTFIAFRLAFSSINDALGAAPDRQLSDAAPEPVRTAVTWGRPPAATASQP
jgi:uncharacterized peroxidase-related enzyme